MPSAKRPDHEIPQVDAFAALLGDALDHAQSVKPNSSIEPPLTKIDFEPLLPRLSTIFPDSLGSEKSRQWAVAETAARHLFSTLVVSSEPSVPVSVLLVLIYAVVFTSVSVTDETPSVPEDLKGLSLDKAYEDLHIVSC